MVAERSSRSGGYAEGLNSRDPADWLTLQQAACELNLSVSTLRRMIRNGRLRNRIVPRRGGFAYLVYAPGNHHNSADGAHSCGPVAVEQRQPLTDGHASNGHASPSRLAGPGSPAIDQGLMRAEQADEIRRLERQVEHLSHALSRALRVKQVALPPGIGAQHVNDEDPYARYRWLVRRKRWWPF